MNTVPAPEVDSTWKKSIGPRGAIRTILIFYLQKRTRHCGLRPRGRSGAGRVALNFYSTRLWRLYTSHYGKKACGWWGFFATPHFLSTLDLRILHLPLAFELGPRA